MERMGCDHNTGFPGSRNAAPDRYVDSRMNMFEETYKGQNAGTISQDKVFGLENSYIYKPLYPEA